MSAGESASFQQLMSGTAYGRFEALARLVGGLAPPPHVLGTKPSPETEAMRRRLAST
jgi:hypothetical protein